MSETEWRSLGVKQSHGNLFTFLFETLKNDRELRTPEWPNHPIEI